MSWRAPLSRFGEFLGLEDMQVWHRQIDQDIAAVEYVFYRKLAQGSGAVMLAHRQKLDIRIQTPPPPPQSSSSCERTMEPPLRGFPLPEDSSCPSLGNCLGEGDGTRLEAAFNSDYLYDVYSCSLGRPTTAQKAVVQQEAFPGGRTMYCTGRRREAELHLPSPCFLRERLRP